MYYGVLTLALKMRFGKRRIGIVPHYMTLVTLSVNFIKQSITVQSRFVFVCSSARFVAIFTESHCGKSHSGAPGSGIMSVKNRAFFR